MGTPTTPKAPFSLRTAADAVPPVWLVLIGIVSVQTGAGVAKNLFEVLPPAAVVWLRLLTAAVLLGLVVRPAWKAYTRGDWLVVIGYGVALATMNFFIYQAFARIPLGIAVTIEYLGPLAIAVLGSRRRVDLLWAGLAGLGVAALGLESGSLDPLGILFAALAAVSWAGYILLSAATGRRFDGASGLAIAGVVGALLMAPAGIAQGGAALLDWRVLLFGLAVGVLSSVVPYTLELNALRRMPPRVFGVLMSLQPAAAALVGLVLLGEMLTVWQWLAVGCVILASAGSTRTSASSGTAEQSP
ncbi:EamA family transporter [Nocardiopsis changdeensis]|uniref:EamA family transporter n=1 Tax=Nocardiopsis changdeensis TaxID=2831969 RepID=A0ABX8BXM5_9ACTN|nr:MULTISPECIES: EamA family transporter [Nocardiopsis]QUX25882.1 EamA family transporter [Nocardiopsis changdeensis]QYX40353.1 EamA family transporter [Nocardiopsis sp. MT53]